MGRADDETGRYRGWAIAAAAALAAGAVALALALSAGDDGSPSPPPPRAPTAAEPSPRTVRVAELQTRITEYCEVRSSGAASAADDRQAAADVEALIRLARSDLANGVGRRALAEVQTVLRVDCPGSPLTRRVERALKALP